MGWSGFYRIRAVLRGPPFTKRKTPRSAERDRGGWLVGLQIYRGVPGSWQCRSWLSVPGARGRAVYSTSWVSFLGEKLWYASAPIIV